MNREALLYLTEPEKEELILEMYEELRYLRHFYSEVDFGPAGSDVRDIINEDYEYELPDGC